MASQCLSCGRPVDEKVKSCICGFHNEGWNFMDTGKKETLKNADVVAATESSSTDILTQTSKEIHLKEIDSWNISYSEQEQCISLGTPALKSFRLKLTVDDLEELLEFLYERTGNGKTIRKLQLSAADISDMIDRVHRVIEEKRSKIQVRFSDNDLQEITSYVNMKLNQ